MRQPLTGIRVLELGGYISAPFGTSMLAALGADVVKVERPGVGDDFRRGKNELETYFRQYNAGKRSLAVDIKRSEGVDLVRSLIPRFDVIVENMRPGKVEALGLGYEVCRSARADIIYTSVTGFGPAGPMAQRPAYDTMGQAFGGIYSILSPRGNAQLSGTCMADLLTGLMTVTGVLAALVGRGATGEGVQVETSLIEAISALTTDAITQYYDDGRVDPDLNSRRPQGQNFVLSTESGEAIAVHLSSSQKFWHSFTLVLDQPELAQDPRFATYALRTENYFELVPIVEAAFAERPAEEWEKLLDKHDVPFAPVMTMSGYLEHPQVRLLEITEPEEDGLALVRPPWRFDGSRPHRSGTTPRVGEHTREVAGEVMDQQHIRDLIAEGVLFAS
ncbi:MAG: CoA transferase [Rhodococcus sp. (in: high G+C Gram-positive bacteria)]|nr:MAG: CoA transferase [Rhodococcus sp. (in: high G+C Gram-positive bacteria)]